MIKKIISEWSQFCEYMGSRIYESNGIIIADNSSTSISCDFSNCLIAKNLSYDFLLHKQNNLLKKGFTFYSIYENDQYPVFDTRPDKIASLMVISRNEWIQKRNEANLSLPNDKKYNIIRFDKDNIMHFGSVVFSAFDYDLKFFEASINLYRKGLRSKKVDYYGLCNNETVMSCVMVHPGRSGEISGLELVSTRPEYQRMGLSRKLITHVINDKFSSAVNTLWLFSIKGSNAEKFYNSLGFRTIANMFIWRFNI